MSGHHHHHHHSGHGHHHHHATGNIKVAFFVNLAFTIIELVGGMFTNSVAILSDALHDLGDSLSLGLSWYFQHKAQQGRDDRYTFGYGRFSLLGAVINSVVLLVGSVFVLKEAIPRLWAPEETKPEGMMALAVVGIIFNGFAVWRLQQGSSINERVVSLHLLEDVLGWVAVLIGSILIYFFEWHIIDPLLSLGVTIFILVNVFRGLKDSFRVFLQARPDGLDVDELTNEIATKDLVDDVHDMHVWTMDGEYVVASLHVVTQATDPQQLVELRKSIRDIFQQKDIEHVTIELHTPDEECALEDC